MTRSTAKITRRLPSRILLVSDSPAERAIYAEAFHAKGYCTLQAATADDACRLAAELPPAAVIADVGQSVCGDGVPLFRRLKQEFHLLTAPVVILAGRPRTDEPSRIEDVGCDLYVARRCRPDDLQRLVSDLIQ